MPKVVVIGLEGFGASQAQDWASDLPNLTAMRRQGLWGVLSHLLPPESLIAWTAAQTGQEPQAFGFWDAYFRDSPTTGEPRRVQSNNLPPDSLFRILDRRGRRVGLINVPGTWPPPTLQNGRCVSGWPLPGVESGYCWPKELEHEVEDLVGELLLEEPPLWPQRRLSIGDTVLDRIYRLDDQRFRLLKNWIKKDDWDYLFAVISGPGQVRRLFSRFADIHHPRYQSVGKYSQAVLSHARFIDDNLGELRSLVDSQTFMLVHSDHGTLPLKGLFNLNQWLLEREYLCLRSQPHVPTPLTALEVDWQHTRAWAVGRQGKIYLNLAGREPLGTLTPDQAADLLAELAQALQNDLRDPQGRPVAVQVLRPAPSPDNATAGFGPDLVAVLEQGQWGVGDELGWDTLWRRGPADELDDAVNAEGGFFCFTGPGLPEGAYLGERSLMDLAPCVLKLLGETIPPHLRTRSLSWGLAAPEIADTLPLRGEADNVETSKFAAQMKIN